MSVYNRGDIYQQKNGNHRFIGKALQKVIDGHLAQHHHDQSPTHKHIGCLKPVPYEQDDEDYGEKGCCIQLIIKN